MLFSAITRSSFSLVLLLVSFLSFSGFAGCQNPLVKDIDTHIEPNLETITVKLKFADWVNMNIGGIFPIKEYGAVEVQAATPDSPFSVGFRLNLGILNDQEYAQYEPVRDLPSGQPLPSIIGRAMAQVSPKDGITNGFDIYSYVDILGQQLPDGTTIREWLGVVVSLRILNNQYIPAGLPPFHYFLRDKAGVVQAVAVVYGPQVNDQGQLKAPGGIGLFANAYTLAQAARENPEHTVELSIDERHGVILLDAPAAR
jgi:hypothetical protein